MGATDHKVYWRWPGSPLAHLEERSNVFGFVSLRCGMAGRAEESLRGPLLQRLGESPGPLKPCGSCERSWKAYIRSA